MIGLLALLAAPITYGATDSGTFTVTRVAVSSSQILTIGTQQAESSSGCTLHTSFRLDMATSAVAGETLATALDAFTAGESLEIGFDTDAADCVNNAPKILWVRVY